MGKRYFEGEFVHAGNLTLVSYVKGKSVDHYINWTLVLDGVDRNKVFYKTKASILPPLQYPQIETIISGVFIVFRLYVCIAQMAIHI